MGGAEENPQPNILLNKETKMTTELPADKSEMLFKVLHDTQDIQTDRVTKLEHRVLSLCSLVHYLIETPNFYDILVESDPFNLGKVLAGAPSPDEFFEEVRKNNLRADAERHLKTVGIHLFNAKSTGNKFTTYPTPWTSRDSSHDDTINRWEAAHKTVTVK